MREVLIVQTAVATASLFATVLPELPRDPPVNYGRPLTDAEWQQAHAWAREMWTFGVAGVEFLEWGAWEQDEDCPEPAPTFGVRLEGAWRPEVTWFVTVPDIGNGGMWTIHEVDMPDCAWMKQGTFANLGAALAHIERQVRPQYRMRRADWFMAKQWAVEASEAGVSGIAWQTYPVSHGNDPGSSPNLFVGTVERLDWAYSVTAPRASTGGRWAVMLMGEEGGYDELGRFETLAGALNRIRPAPTLAQ